MITAGATMSGVSRRPRGGTSTPTAVVAARAASGARRRTGSTAQDTTAMK
ncbi:hypothetical protein SGRIM128S_01598 [Streptomyces griseomycini]